MKHRMFKPGEFVQRSGIYRVEHEKHRLMHEATLLEETRFPVCRQCGTAVRFSLLHPIESRKILPFRSNPILLEFPESSMVLAS